VPGGPAINATLLDMGSRFRMVVNEVDVIQPEKPLSKLPVASVVWVPRPNLKVAAAAWILAGGAHHTGFTQSLTVEYFENFAEMAGIEFLLIDENTCISEWKKELRWNEIYYLLAKGF
jgi:L-arabinose isomerase